MYVYIMYNAIHMYIHTVQVLKNTAVSRCAFSLHYKYVICNLYVRSNTIQRRSLLTYKYIFTSSPSIHPPLIRMRCVCTNRQPVKNPSFTTLRKAPVCIIFRPARLKVSTWSVPVLHHPFPTLHEEQTLPSLKFWKLRRYTHHVN